MMATFTQAICGAMLIASLSTGSVLAAGPAEPGDQAIDLTKVGVFLAAADYRRAVEACGGRLHGKPRRPKESFESILRQFRIPRSNALYGELAGKESLEGCVVPSFNRFVDTLRKWFPR